MKKELITVMNELQQIYVCGIDTKHMYFALSTLEGIIKMLPDDMPPEEPAPEPEPES